MEAFQLWLSEMNSTDLAVLHNVRGFLEHRKLVVKRFNQIEKEIFEKLELLNIQMLDNARKEFSIDSTEVIQTPTGLRTSQIMRTKNNLFKTQGINNVKNTEDVNQLIPKPNRHQKCPCKSRKRRTKVGGKRRRQNSNRFRGGRGRGGHYRGRYPNNRRRGCRYPRNATTYVPCSYFDVSDSSSTYSESELVNGFTPSEVEELLQQQVKPYDDDAASVLAFLRGGCEHYFY
ncbi:unnamed protein product [Heterobilharzia americana]|nr:unnamed protein product [Heterobilharzia americana]